MVLLLARAGGKASMSLERLEAFSKIRGGNATNISYDDDTKMVTLSLPDIKVKKPVIALPDKRIII